MKIRHLFAVLLMFITASASAQMADMKTPVDQDVRIGKLDNGLTYFIRHNNWPEHRANFYIAQKVGSIQEEESQRGLAHFLEHMAFNGSTHFKGNSLIEWCRAHGIEFGADLNAYTSIDQTVYNIDNVPTTNQGTLDSCLLILSDWSNGLLLEQDEIEKERGVIHEEWRLRTSAQSRMLERNLPNLYPGSKYGLRYPIGLMSVVDNFKRQELVDYYHKWYHPSHQGIIVVGDVDVDHTEAMIKKLFGSIKNPDNEAKIVAEPVPDNAEPIIIIDKDKEFRQSMVELMIKHEAFPDSMKQTVPYLVQNYAKSAAIDMLNKRFTEAAQKAECPFVAASASDGNYIFAKTKDAFDLSAAPKDMSQTAAALKTAYTLVKQAVKHGFTATEYQRYQSDVMSELDKAYSNKDKRYNSTFYSEILGYFLNNEPMTGIDYYYQMMKQVVPAIPLEVINQVLPELVPDNDSNMVILNFNNEKPDAVYPTQAELLDAVHQARATEVSAYVDNVKNEPLITTMPKAGKIVSETPGKKFDYKVLKLSNGVTVLLKKTDYKKDQVIMQGVGGQGSGVYGKGDFANLKMFDQAIGYSGLANFSSTELSKALAGKIANANLTMGARRMAIDGNATPKDVETMLQMAYLYFTNIKKDPDAYGNMMQQFEVALKNRDLDPNTAFSDSLQATVNDHDWRSKPLLLNDLKSVNYDRILQMAKERTANANGWIFEIVGNFDEATIRPLICQYLGALPSKKGKNEASKRMSQPTSKNIDNHFSRKMETPKANSIVAWLNHKMPYSLENSVKADVAGQVLAMVYLREIREEASAAYSCGAQGSMTTADDGFHLGQILAYCPMKPEKKDIALKIIDDEMANLAKSCDAEMLSKVQKLMLKQIDDQAKTNGFWSGVVLNHYMMGLDDYTNYRSTVSSLTPAAISQFVKEYLAGANKVSVVMMPQE
jgi:zinc protease